MIKDYLTFIHELPRSFSEIGAMIPSSRYLGKAMVDPILQAQQEDRPLSILEVGPGTGPFTRQILKLMRAEDRFVICEINKRFLARLKQTLQENSDFLANSDRIKFIEGSVLDLQGQYEEDSFDFIVSSLPLANFSPEWVDAVFKLFDSLLVKGGSLTFFEYAGLKKLSIPFRSHAISTRVREVDEIVRDRCNHVAENGVVQRKLALFNVPPAISTQLTM